MKMNKKKVLSLSLVIVLIAILSFGTLAWFNDTEKVTNTFYVASSSTDGGAPDTEDEIFSVDVWENADTDGDGELDDNDGDGTPDKFDQGATFEDILPGAHIAKAPYVENTGKYQQYVRVIITFDSKDDWHKLVDGQHSNPMGLLNLGDCWINGDSVNVNGAYAYVFYLDHALQPGDKVPVFTTVTIPNTLEQENVVGMGELKLTVRADAIQVENVGASSAKEAFDSVGWTPGIEYPST